MIDSSNFRANSFYRVWELFENNDVMCWQQLDLVNIIHSREQMIYYDHRAT